MAAILPTVVPVFGLILIGYLAGRTGFVSDIAARALPEFMFKICMPALLFRTLATTGLPDTAPWAIAGAYFGAAAVVWLAATLLSIVVLRRPAADAPSIAMGSAFSNVLMMGVPVAIAHFGPEAAAPMALIVALDVPLMWTAAAAHLALAEGPRSVGAGALVRALVLRLATNPIIVASVGGLAWKSTGLGLSPMPDRILSLLGQAGVPGALCALGLTLSTYEIRGQVSSVVAMTVLNLLAMPAVTWLLASYVLDVPPATTAMLVLAASMPVGANAFLFAATYGKAAASVSGAIAVSTLLSVVTVSAALVLLGGAGS